MKKGADIAPKLLVRRLKQIKIYTLILRFTILTFLILYITTNMIFIDPNRVHKVTP